MSALEQKPEEAVALLQSILGSTPDFICLLDEKGAFIYLNRVVSGFKEEEVVGTSLLSYIAPEFTETVKSSIQKCLATGQPVTYETKGLGPDKMPAYYFCRLSPCTFNGKRALLCISTDLTGYKSMETELRRKIEELEILTKSMTGRELKMAELKKEIEQLKKSS